MQNIIDFINKFAKELENANTIEKLHKIQDKYNIDICEKDFLIHTKAYNKIFFKNLLLKLIKKTKTGIIKNHTHKTNINLNKVLKSKLFHPKELNNLFNKYPHISRNIGYIPYVFLKNIKNKNKNEIAAKIFDLCSSYSFDLMIGNSEQSQSITDFENALGKIINNKVKADYIGQGHNGNVYKLTIDNKEFVYKCFFTFNNNDDYLHGKNTEPQYAYYTSIYEKNRFAKFYFGKVCSKYDFDGFIVTEYIDKNSQKENKKNNILQSYYEYLSIPYLETRKIDNLIAGKIVDFGGISENQTELKNKKVRYFINLISKNINCFYKRKEIKYIWKADYKNIINIKNGINKFNNKEDFIRALDFIKKHINHFPQDLYNDLKQVSALDKSYHYLRENTFDIKSVFNKNINDIIDMLKDFKLKFQHQDCYPELNMNGYIQIDLYDNLLAVINYNYEKVLNIRIEKFINNEFIVLLCAEKADDLTDFCISEF